MSKLFSPPFSPKDTCPHPSPAADVAYNASAAGTTLSEPTPDDDFDLSSLPTGWDTVAIGPSSHRGTFVILAFSIALAVIILAMMFMCHFWGRKRVRKRDPEKMRGRMVPELADDDSARSIREAKAAQRKWSKAVSRWRDNIRPSARRRRTNRIFSPAASSSTLAQEDRGETANTTTESPLPHSQSRPSSPTPTQWSATPTHHDVHPSPTASLHSLHAQTQMPPVSAPEAPPTDTPPSMSPRLRPLSIQPPAYHARRYPSSPPAPDVSPEYTYPDREPPSTSKAPLSSHPHPQPHSDDDGQLSGHVATDDKAILSLRAALASAPPESNSSFPQSASVPSIEEEYASMLFSGSRPSSLSHDVHGFEPQPPYSPPRSLLPPPPLKGKQKFDYSHDLDISDIPVEPELGPSAPPFEEQSEAVPSAPPLDFDSHVPSAPPMDSED